MKDTVKIVSMDTHVDDVKERRFVALVGPEMVGQVGLLTTSQGLSTSFRQLFVALNYRRLGIGRKLVYCCIEHAEQLGYRSIGLCLAKGNAVGEAFYKSLGFFAAYEYEDGEQMYCKLISDEVSH